MNLKGVVPVLMSPIQEDGSPDEEGYHRLLDFTAPHAGGYWVLGSASEDFLIPYPDRVRIARIVAGHVNGALPVVVGCGSPVVSETHRFLEETVDLPVTGYHVLPTDRRMAPASAYRYCKSIADRAPKPVWLYNNGMRGLQIPVPVVKDLMDHPNIAGIKAAGFDLMDIIPFCMMNRETFQTVGSGASHMLLFLAMGCSAHTVSPACCFPQEFREIYDLWAADKPRQAREKFFALCRLLGRIPHADNTEVSAEEKAGLEIMGICKRHVYPPFVASSDEEAAHIRRVLQDAGHLDSPIER